MPILDKIFWKNPIFMWLSRYGLYDDTFPAVPFAMKAMAQRDRDDEGRLQDLLAKFLQSKETYPQVVGDREVLALAISMVVASSETTLVCCNYYIILLVTTFSAITLSSIFYYLLKNPRCMQKLQQELDALPTQESSSRYHIVSFSDAQQLPYLDICIKKSFRVHPAPGFDLERIVPDGGAKICGEHIVTGAIVSCNAWVIHRSKEIFGPDADICRPERWLEDPERARVMGSTLFQFGMGTRSCIGKNISLLEVYKVVPSVLKTFEVC